MIVVIGAGAAGMMAAITAAQAGAPVTVLERNNFCGVKLNITGKGRCNVTNACSPQELMENITRNAKFLYSAFSSMSSQDVMNFFESLGVPLKIERGNRVFPVSDRAKDITNALKHRMDDLHVRIVHEKASTLEVEDGRAVAVITQSGRRVTASAVILACGGQSYPRTGSDGSGYYLAKAAGHSVTETRPSLVPLVLEGNLPSQLEGLSLRNVRLTVKKDGKTIFTEQGEMVFTSNGVSGPLVLSASAHLGRKQSFPYQLLLDLKPALDAETLDRRLLRDFSEKINRDYSNVLSGLLPAKMIPVVVMLSGIPPREKVNSITREQREKIGSILKALCFTVTGYGSWHEAVVTSGGVEVREVSPRTMESKIVKGLFFAGEILDVDAYTGGFNLQIAWATGHCAGLAAAKGAL